MKNKNILKIELLFSGIIIIVVVIIVTLANLQINYNVQKIAKNNIASNMATNILENINSRTYDNINEYIQAFSGVGVTKKLDTSNQNIIIDGNIFNESFFGTTIQNDYIVEFNSENPSSDFDVVKYITININFNVNGNEENFEISTIIEKESVRECNIPVISDSYFRELGFNSDDYDFIPIKYSYENKSFITTTQNDIDWYNYSAKKWAKILVFSRDADNLKDLFIDENGIIRNQINYGDIVLDVKNYIYVWIPNFSIRDDVSYFRYGTSKRAIKLDFQYLNGKYLYLNRASEEIRDISEDCTFDGIYGVWKKLDDIQDVYYTNFNKTKYAPINLY